MTCLTQPSLLNCLLKRIKRGLRGEEELGGSKSGPSLFLDKKQWFFKKVKKIEGEKKKEKDRSRVQTGEGVPMTTIDIPSPHTFEVMTKLRLYQ